ncbi:hypothetical protein JCM18237_29970 [Halorubrum luteum]
MGDKTIDTVRTTLRGRVIRAYGRARYAAIGGAIGGGLGGLVSRNAASTGAGLGALVGAIVGETRTDVDSIVTDLLERGGDEPEPEE